MNGSESEVVARRLRDTFKKFYLNAHPSIFFLGLVYRKKNFNSFNQS